MNLGYPRVVACPTCDRQVKHLTFLSWNTLGVQRWTDGKVVAPMPLPPPVVRCQGCRRCYWLNKARVIGSLDFWEPPAKSSGAADGISPAEEPAEEEYYDAIESGLAETRDEEKLLRRLAWWRHNDVVRESRIPPLSESPLGSERWRANLLPLADLLSNSIPDELLLKAEIRRELGDFDAARRLLAEFAQPQAFQLGTQIHSLCESRDTIVRQLHSPVSARPPTPTLTDLRRQREATADLWELIERKGWTCSHCRSTGKAVTDFRLSTGSTDLIICRRCGWTQEA